MNRDGSNQRLAVNCAADRCITPNWAPDGSRLAYSRQNAGIAPGAPHGPPRVWTLDIASGQTAAMYQDSQVLGYGPSWSPDGRRIAAFDGSIGGIRVLDLQTGDVMILPSQMGVVGTWAPDGQTMLYNDLSIVGEQPYVQMYLANFQTKEVNLTFEAGEARIDYSVPVWSPDGQWAAAGLKNALSGGGNQLWIMRPDGSEGRAIADDPKYTYGAYRWDPWSQSLVFQRFELGEPFAKPEIMMWSPGDGVRLIAQDASMPAWLP
jgi:Tol biopolymer transport system component